MRLDKFTIGSQKVSPTHQFKNLKDVTIDFDQEHWVTVVIGWNGTGKSNVLEALAIIFRDLIGKKRTPEFAFKLAYSMGSGNAMRHIHIDADPDRVRSPFIIYVASAAENKQAAHIAFDNADDSPPGSLMKLTTFLSEDELNLPKYVFSYYSGESTRMHEVFRPYLEGYDNKLRHGEDPGLKRLFYAMPVHSQFVLLAFLIQQTDIVREFLDKHLGLDPDEGIDSVLFVLKQPGWSRRRGKRKTNDDGDGRFWGAKGVVQGFLNRLQEIALAPVRISRKVPITLWNEETIEFLYLYVKDINALRTLVGNQEPAKLFRDLESTYVSEFIEEVRIRIRLNKNDGSVTFRELSEGEQQLLTVLGLLRFTAENESLFLLDEPDTHLNPRWCADYLKYLQDFVGQNEMDRATSHIVFTTHNPLAIAELVKQQVQILKRDDESHEVAVYKPELDPRGMGYAAIVTSEMFGIASSLDKSTQVLLEKQRLYAGKSKLDITEQSELDEINARLELLGYRFSLADDEYSRYLRLRNQKLEAKFAETDIEKIAAGVLAMTRDEREALADELIDALMNEESLSAKVDK